MATTAVFDDLSNFVSLAQKASSQTAKFLTFSKFVERAYGVQVEELIPGIEKKIGSKILGVRGSIDLLFSYVVLEFKTDFARELDDGKAELAKYFQALLEQDPSKKYVGVVTDCLKYSLFIPSISNGKVVGLDPVGPVVDISTLRPEDALLFIDAFLFSKSGLKPTAVDLSIKFGPRSPTFALATKSLEVLWQKVQKDNDAALKLRLWTSNMSIVYGREPPVESFLGQTFLVTLVKLLIYLRLSGDRAVNASNVVRALTGEYFSSFGISNLIEEDYFSWILAPKIRTESADLGILLAKELLKYDTSSVDEDLFKEIYQTVVQQGERHRTGEYYTPEWLSQIALNEAVAAWSSNNRGLPRILDPACGSGTFLTNAIQWMRGELTKASKGGAQALDAILENVVGVDVNPVAVVIARANYILALGEYLRARKQITIPVFVSDSVNIPKLVRTYIRNVDTYDIEANGAHLQIPARLVKNQDLLQELLQGMKAGIGVYRTRKNKAEARAVFRDKTKGLLDEADAEVTSITFDNLIMLVDKGPDSIWVFVLSNICAPIVLKEDKFDIVIGNPPWIVMRTIENKDYQDFLKKQVLHYGLLDKDEVKLFTHMEMATLFFCRASDLYLKDGGVVCFLMPISVITAAQQHAGFKKFQKPSLELSAILDFEKIRDIFSLPVCVLIARKGGTTRYPIRKVNYFGRISRYIRNEKLGVLKDQLRTEDELYELPKAPSSKKRSHYFDLFREGATLVPRNLWFVDFDTSPVLGIDVSEPLLRTSQEVIEVGKEEWKDAVREGKVEREYIYATVLGKDLIHFGVVKFRPVVLPIEPRRKGYSLPRVDVLRVRPRPLVADWVEANQAIWEKRRTQKSEQNYPLVTDRLDHNALLTGQDPNLRYAVVFNARGADAAACVIDKTNLPPFQVGGSSLAPRGFVADTTDFYCETDDEKEAHYLASILNSSVINQAVKPFQPRGNYGFRDIGRRPLMFPVPKFDPSKEDHLKLADLSRKCHSVVAGHKFTMPGAFKSMRNEAQRLLANEIKEIDALVKRAVKV